MRMNRLLLASAAICCAASLSLARAQQTVPDSDVTSKSVPAIGYEIGAGSTKVALVPAKVAPQAGGEAKVEAKKGGTSIEAKVSSLPQPTTLGAELLTYVLWAVTPDGAATNLGEVTIDKNGNGKLSVNTAAQTFSLIVTAEPYYAVRIPSETLVLQNEQKKNTKGKVFPDTNFKLMQRSQYVKSGNPLALTPDLKTAPLDVYEARNAVEIARSRGAQQYAPEIFSKAEASLKMMESNVSGKADKNQVLSQARQTIQFAEDARSLSAQRAEDERVAKEKEAAAAAAAAQAKAQAEAQAATEAQRQAELTAAKEAQMKAEAAAQQAQAQAQAAEAAAKAKADADAAAARQAQLQAQEQAARDAAEKAQRDAAALRAQLLEQFNRVLETTDTPRGLVVNMADVLFDTAKYNLRPEAREKLAKLSGIVLAHPGLHLAVEGHTDSTGSDDFNMKLSQQRAEAVRDYLIQQGVAQDTLTAQGFGKADPVADNGTAAGRQRNRRVEIIVSGEVIGQKIGK